jgi:hypothetical protein
LVVTNSAGTSVDASVNISVAVPLPVASITAYPQSITSGSSTTIIPIFSNHVTALINGSAIVQGQSFVSGTSINTGTLTQGTTYTLVVTNSAGISVDASVVINVTNPVGWSGNIQFNKFAGAGSAPIHINIRAGNASVLSTTNTTSIATNTVYTTDININVSLQTPQTYLYISVHYTSPSSYYVSNETLVDRKSGSLPITYFDSQILDFMTWRRYSVPNSAGATLYFGFETIHN